MLQDLRDLIPIEYLFVAAVVLAVLFVITLAFRMLAGRGSGQESSRLGVSESLEIDRQRRLILLRRDDVEHLVLIGGAQDLVVESVIRPGVQRRNEAPAAPRVVPADRLEDEPTVSRSQPASRPVALRAARPPVIGDQMRDGEPAQRAEPRLEPLKSDEQSREA